MAEDAKDTTAATTETTGNTTSAATENTEQSIPYSRFKEVNAAKTAAEKELARLKDAEAKRLEAEQLANGEYQKVIDDLKPKAERVTALEAALKTYLDAEIAEIPESMRDLIQGGDITEQLKWIKAAKAKGVFGTPRAPEMDAGARGDRPQKPPTAEAQRATNIAAAYGYSLDPAKVAERARQIADRRARPTTTSDKQE